jgi:long-chain acyl-CoA synthetase
MPEDPKPFIERLQAKLRQDPDAVILDYFGAPMTRGQLAGIARAIVAQLDDASVPADASVGLIMRNRPLHVAAVLGLVAASRSLTSIYGMQAPSALAADIAESKFAAVIAERKDFTPEVVDALCRNGVVGIALDTDMLEIAALDQASHFARARDYRRAAAEPGLELLSSGTTGKPKRIRFPFRLLERSVETIRAGLTDGAPPPDIVTWSFSGIAMGNIIANIMLDRYMSLIDRFNVDNWVEAVRRLRPAYVTGPPAVAQMIVDANVAAEDLSSISYYYGGSAAMPVELQKTLLDRYGIATIWAYGATEFAGTVISWSLDLYRRYGTAKMGAMGKPLPGIQIRVVDTVSGAALPIGETGYLEAIVPALGPDWIRTTDLARIDEDGFVYHLGRGDGAIVRGGFKIQPETIADALARHPAVLEAAVVGIPDRRVGEVPAAAVQLRQGQPSDLCPAALQAFVREALPATYVPAIVRIVDALPRTASMKVDLGALKRLFVE